MHQNSWQQLHFAALGPPSDISLESGTSVNTILPYLGNRVVANKHMGTIQGATQEAPFQILIFGFVCLPE